MFKSYAITFTFNEAPSHFSVVIVTPRTAANKTQPRRKLEQTRRTKLETFYRSLVEIKKQNNKQLFVLV